MKTLKWRINWRLYVCIALYSAYKLLYIEKLLLNIMQ